MKDTTHEDAEMLARIASVVGRLSHANCLRLLGYAKGLALTGTAGPTCHDAIRVASINEAGGLCDAYSIETRPAIELLLEIFQNHGPLGHADISSFKRLKPWEESARDLEVGK